MTVQISSHSFLSRIAFAMLVAGSATIASAAIVQTNDTVQSETFGYSMPANNLIQAGSPTLSSQVDFSANPAIPIAQPGFAGLAQMNDGVISIGKPVSNTEIALMDGSGGTSDLYQVFVLDLAGAPLGYDLTQAAVFASWTANGLDPSNSRIWQNWQIGYNLVGEVYSGSGELNHFLPATTPYQFIQPSGYGTDKVTLTDDTGTLVSGVSALQIRWLNNGQGANLTAYSEVALSGVATVPEPSTLVLLTCGLVGITWRKRK